MSRFTQLCVCFVALAACSCVDEPFQQRAASDRRSTTDGYATDNTGLNVRDRDGGTLTPLDQSDSARDVTITQQIRHSITGDKTMSLDAHNVKIITIEGVVTLRGPVKSVDEKLSIASIAETTPGVLKVDNQLEIKRQ
jgi:hyperosmotically inducible protein